MNTVVREKEFEIHVDGVKLVWLYNIDPTFAKIISPCATGEQLNKLPPEVELVDVYHRIYSPDQFKSWPRLAEYEAELWQSFAAGRATIETCDQNQTAASPFSDRDSNGRGRSHSRSRNKSRDKRRDHSHNSKDRSKDRRNDRGKTGGKNDTKLLNFNVIYTYAPSQNKDDDSQEVLDIALPKMCEAAFVKKLLENARARGRDVIKISTCLMSIGARQPTIKDLPKYLAARSGKYYFSDEDADTKKWKAFRDRLTDGGAPESDNYNEYVGIVIGWLKEQREYSLVGNYALARMIPNECSPSGVIQIIVGNIQSAISSLTKRLEQFIPRATIEIRTYDLQLPTDYRIKKYVVVARVGRDVYYVANLFNCASFEMIPIESRLPSAAIQSKSTADLVVAAFPVVLRFLFIELWFTRMVHGFGKISSQEYSRLVKILVRNINAAHNAYLTENSIDSTEPPKFIGVYINESISKKSNDMVAPYFPAQYKAAHGEYRDLKKKPTGP